MRLELWRHVVSLFHWQLLQPAVPLEPDESDHPLLAVAPADPVVESVIWRICLFVLFYFACVVHTVVHITEQILVNKSDKSDHPHQREPWCFVEVVNKVGAAAMPTLQ